MVANLDFLADSAFQGAQGFGQPGRVNGFGLFPGQSRQGELVGPAARSVPPMKMTFSHDAGTKLTTNTPDPKTSSAPKPLG